MLFFCLFSPVSCDFFLVFYAAEFVTVCIRVQWSCHCHTCCIGHCWCVVRSPWLAAVMTLLITLWTVAVKTLMSTRNSSARGSSCAVTTSDFVFKLTSQTMASQSTLTTFVYDFCLSRTGHIDWNLVTEASSANLACTTRSAWCQTWTSVSRDDSEQRQLLHSERGYWISGLAG